MTVAAPADLARRSSPQGQVALEDRFEVLKEIGDGSFGSVVLARVRTAGANVARRGSIVAIKSMKKTFDSIAPCLELREVVFLRTIPNHPHLVPALDIFLDPHSKKLHICMEYMEGNLYQLMKARDHKCLDNASVKSVLFQIMRGLEHIHSHNFFHRDIKPENILVSTSSHQEASNSFRRYSALVTPPSTPPHYTVKLADFGLARETHSKLPYTTYVSTRWYRAPEVLLRAGEYSAPVDIWAVGAMAVEVATLKPLFPGGNEVDQVWRVCEIMGSPGNWYNKAGVRVGGGDWREGTRLASKLGFSFPKMAPHAMDTILQAPQWPASLSSFVTWCLMWDPKNRPTSSQALMHEYFNDAVDPTRPKSSASKILGRKQSDLGRTVKESSSTTQIASLPSWFRKSLIGRSDVPEPAALQVPNKETPVTRPSLASVPTVEAPASKARAPPAAKRSTWTHGLSNVAPMPILPTIRPISPLSDAVTARANRGQAEVKSKKLGRQLSVASSSNACAEMHRQQAERALNGETGLASPPSGHKESFFSHLRKRARRFSGRHQTPVSPSYEDMEAQIGCGPWASNRSSVVIDPQGGPIPKAEVYESLDKALRDVQGTLDSRSALPASHQPTSTSRLKRHHSLPHQQPRSVDNLLGAARGGPISSRTRRAQAAHGARQYEVPDEEDELLDEALTSAQRAMRHMDGSTKPLRQSASNLGLATPHPYPSPSPSASGSQVLYGDGQEVLTPKPLDLGKKPCSQYKWPTPPYEGSEWGASASASIWAAGNF
ncbi:serine/threonine-protein kinase MAK [Metarhizium album ARSEF 1941]|uniref:Serine/threonine-protein kinase MAK n=1 Tax=Metarhizium album (strain ARSEF 1941) TaxID=1081103 RepID=A0A0B2WUI9_METAS|nr:serine/threonine-protein kinase MAK [Metarhizium album ARSEF 1941]KHN97733.1 serine/threonine-protein kinase MAK [Metarhizium album ARSEF 1941]